MEILHDYETSPRNILHGRSFLGVEADCYCLGEQYLVAYCRGAMLNLDLPCHERVDAWTLICCVYVVVISYCQ